MLEKLFNPRGRVNRLQNIGYELLMVLIMMILGMIIAIIVLGVGYLFGAYNDLFNSEASTITSPTEIGLFIICIPIVAGMYSNIIIKIKRLHDINLSGWWLPIFLLFGLPYIALYFWPGTNGRNKFDDGYKSQEKIQNDISLAKSVYNHSKDIASEIKPAINEYKEKHSTSNFNSQSTPTVNSNISQYSEILNEDEIYEKIMIEIEEDKKVKSTWAKALAQSDGNKDKAESLYINLRVNQIKEEIRIIKENKLSEENAIGDKRFIAIKLKSFLKKNHLIIVEKISDIEVRVNHESNPMNSINIVYSFDLKVWKYL